LNFKLAKETYWSIAGTAKCPDGVIIAPGTSGPSTGTMKLLGIPVLFLMSIV
jgi:hypothetical protein